MLAVEVLDAAFRVSLARTSQTAQLLGLVLVAGDDYLRVIRSSVDSTQTAPHRFRMIRRRRGQAMKLLPLRLAMRETGRLAAPTVEE
jgi:hypothetical protein